MASLTSEYLTEEKYLDEVDKMMKFQQKKA